MKAAKLVLCRVHNSKQHRIARKMDFHEAQKRLFLMRSKERASFWKHCLALLGQWSMKRLTMAWHFSNGLPEEPRERDARPFVWNIATHETSPRHLSLANTNLEGCLSHISSDRKCHPSPPTFAVFHDRTDGSRSFDTKLIKEACKGSRIFTHIYIYTKITKNIIGKMPKFQLI